MKSLKHVYPFLVVCLFSMLLVNCEKVDPRMEMLDDPNSELNASALKAAPMDASDEIDYLKGLIETIESLLEDGELSKGNANALISKIENAIKSIEKGNMNAFSGQLDSFINQTEDFIENGVIPEDIGEELINTAENGIILAEGRFIDPRDGQEYKVVLIGDQLWMAENLRASMFNDGTEIPLVTDDEIWGSLRTPGYCWRSNDEATYGSIYGALYNGYAVLTGKLGPTGWHVPSEAEWLKLQHFLGGRFVAGNYLKEAGTSNWISPNSGTNETGFTALPGGSRTGGGIGTFDNRLGYWGFWWSSTLSTDGPWVGTVLSYISLYHRHASFVEFYQHADWGMSVRCIKD